MNGSIWKLEANCKLTEDDCGKFIPNSVCLAEHCKCKIGYGPTLDYRACKKSKKFGSTCSNSDTCYHDKLICDIGTQICICASGFRYDSNKNDCNLIYYCEDNSIWDSRSNSCIKQTDFWFPSNHNPKLSFITFILLVFCFIKVMRSNSPYNERRRRISTNMNRNSLDFISTIINYENGQRYPLRNNGLNNSGRYPNRNHHSRRGNENNQEPYYDENPPAYADIISDDLKQVTVEQTTNDTNYLNNQLIGENIELKELHQDRRKLNHHPIYQTNEQVGNNQPLLNSQTNFNNNQIEIQSTSSSETTSLENTTSSTNGLNQEHLDKNNILNNSNLINEQSQLNNNQSNYNLTQSSNSRLNNQIDDNILPTYEQAISKMPPV